MESRLVRRIIALFLFSPVIAMTGCERTRIIRAECVAPASRGGQGLVPGERVVARFKKTFREGTVITVQDRLVTVGWDDSPPERSYLPRSWVRTLERRGSIRQGQWILCRSRETWELCRVEGVVQEKVQATLTSDGESWKLALRDTWPLPSKLAKWAADRGGRLLIKARRARMLAGARPGTVGQELRTGQRVLAEWMKDSWWEAKIVTIDRSAVTVTWKDSSGRQTVQLDQVAPLTAAAVVLPGTLAFCKWQGSGQWWQAWIERVSSTRARVTFKDGKTSQVPLEHCLPSAAQAEQD